MKQETKTLYSGTEIHKIDNFHILIIKAIGATNNSPAMVKIISERFQQSIKLSFTNHPGASSPAIDTAVLYLQERGWDIVGKGEGKDHYYIITSTFQFLK